MIIKARYLRNNNTLPNKYFFIVNFSQINYYPTLKSLIINQLNNTRKNLQCCP